MNMTPEQKANSTLGYFGRTFETSKPKPASWTLPPPPAGQEWHRTDWTEDMLPDGWRPLLKGEAYKNGDEYKHYSEWRVETNVSSYQTTDYCHYHTRTRRPLPTPPRMAPLGPAISRCCTCGAEWLTGEDGSHSCAVVLGRKLAKCREALKQIAESTVMRSHDAGECIAAEHRDQARETLDATK